MSGLRYRIRKFLPAVISLVIFTLLFPGCSAIDSGKEFVADKLTAEDEMDAAVEVVDNFFALLMEKDLEQAYEYLSAQDRKNRSPQDFFQEFADVTDIVKVEINWVEVKNNVALVGIDIMDSYDGEEKLYKDIEVSLIKEEDGSWKIVFWN